jgi:hypothetical protein
MSTATAFMLGTGVGLLVLGAFVFGIFLGAAMADRAHRKDDGKPKG